MEKPTVQKKNALITTVPEIIRRRGGDPPGPNDDPSDPDESKGGH